MGYLGGFFVGPDHWRGCTICALSSEGLVYWVLEYDSVLAQQQGRKEWVMATAYCNWQSW